MLDDIFSDLRKLQEDVNKAFREMQQRASNFKEGFKTPAIDVREDKNTVITSIELPGIEEKEIKLKINPQSVEIKVERKLEKRVQTEKYLHNERKYRAFYRAFPLPKKVVPAKATRIYKDGILKITMPKAKETIPSE